MNKTKAFNIVLLCVEILLALLILLPLAFFAYNLIEGVIEDLANVGDEHYCGGTVFYRFFSHAVLAAVNAALFIIGLIFHLILKKKNVSPLHQTMFRLLTLGPIASQVIYIVISVIVMLIL